jgi:2,4'-dihydroxyacetophenone dioxygenase
VTISAADLLEGVIEQYGAGDGGEIGFDDIPWIPYKSAPGVEFKPLRFDVARARYTNLARLGGPGGFGRHLHTGEVVGYVLEGSWYYQEYDWVAKPGSIIHEPPGGIHTLICDDPNGMTTLFFVEGTVEYIRDDGSHDHTENVFWFVNEYANFCRENGLEVDKRLFY